MGDLYFGKSIRKNILSDIMGTLAYEIIILYHILTVSKRKYYSPKELLAALNESVNGGRATMNERILLNNEDSILKALKWLNSQWFPVKQVGNKWKIYGPQWRIEKIISPSEWPANLRDRWFSVQGDETLHAVSIRIRLIKELYGLTYGEILEGTGVDPKAFRNLIARWSVSQRISDDNQFFVKLEEISELLGVEEHQLRTGYLRSEREPHVLKDIRKHFNTIHFGQVVYKVRMLLSVSRETFVKIANSYSHGSTLDWMKIYRIETETRKTLVPKYIPLLAKASNIDPFIFIAGTDKISAIKQATKGMRIRLLRLSIGLRVKELAFIMGVDPTTVSDWELDQLPVNPALRPKLALKLGVDTSIIEEENLTDEHLSTIENEYASSPISTTYAKDVYNRVYNYFYYLFTGLAPPTAYRNPLNPEDERYSVFEQIIDAAKTIRLDPALLEILLTPEQIIKVKFNVTLNDGNTYEFNGWRIQHNSARGPYKGGLRFHISVTEGGVFVLATEMSLKTAVIGIPLGGRVKAEYHLRLRTLKQAKK